MLQSLFGWAQSYDRSTDLYYILDKDSLPRSVIFTKVKLNAKHLYGVNAEIELFNLIDGYRLILFSALPDLKSTGSNWKAVSPIVFKNKVLSYNELKNFADKQLEKFSQSDYVDVKSVKNDNIKLVVKEKGNYLISNFCLTEFFIINNHQRIFPNESNINVINTLSPPFGVKEFENAYKDAYHKTSPNIIYSDIRTSLTSPKEKPLLFRSATTESFAGLKAWKFWSFNSWNVMDGLNKQRGVDRFLYVPNKGIVGGSFDFWFENLSDGKLAENYLNELVMYPIAIDDKPIIAGK